MYYAEEYVHEMFIIWVYFSVELKPSESLLDVNNELNFIDWFNL